MLLIEFQQNDSLSIPFDDNKNMASVDSSQIEPDVKIVEYKNELVRTTAGIFKNNKIDGLKYERNFRRINY